MLEGRTSSLLSGRAVITCSVTHIRAAAAGIEWI